jgi:phosphate transport system substrate-binding protein
VKLSLHHRVGAVALTGALVLSLAACGSDNATGASTKAATGAALSGELSGAGSSAQESAMEAWRAGFQSSNPDANVNYDPVGSGGGRTQFLDGSVPFAGSDAALTDDEITKSKATCKGGQGIDLPVYVSPIAVVFNLKGVKELNLAPAVIAGIFSGKIKNWNAPQIAADNPTAKLPDLAITPVNRSDDSGTTKNFTQYLVGTAAKAWPYKAAGIWPTKGGQSAQGTSGVVQAVQGGQGTITYADASKAGELGTAKIKVGDQWVGHSPEGASASVDASPITKGRAAHDIAIDIDRASTDPKTYPMVLVSYEIVCTTYSDAKKGALVKGFLNYVASDEGQQAAASAAGSAPISATLRKDVQAAIDSIKVGA